MEIDFRRHPVELIAREDLRQKTDRQRGLFHAVCTDLGTAIGYWPGEMKSVVKLVYFGDEWERFSTEDLDYEHYGHLIECAYSIAADLGIVIPDRRRQ